MAFQGALFTGRLEIALAWDGKRSFSLQVAAGFEIEVAIGEGDWEVLRGGVQQVDALGAEGAEQEGAFLLVGAVGSVAEGTIEAVDGLLGALGEFLLAQGGDQHAMAAAEQLNGGLQVAAVLGAEVGEKDDEGAALLVGEDALGSLGEVAGLGGGLVVVEVIQDDGHGVTAFDGFQPAGLAPEIEDAYLVPLTQGDVGEKQHGVEAVVELGEFAIEGAHPAAAVGHEQKGLVALLFKLAADEGVAAGGGLPVDAGEGVAILIVAELLEIE